MRLMVRHEIDTELVLPINYHHMLQGIIYRHMEASHGYSDYMHEQGFSYGNRHFKLFTFSLLRGKYEIKGKYIVFRQEVSFEVSSPEIFMIRILAESMLHKGISYGGQYFPEVEIYLSDEMIEEEWIDIKMLSPISVYSTDKSTGKTYFYTPQDELFGQMVNENFIRKYQACYGVEPDEDIRIESLRVRAGDKYVTKYKNYYISGWMGEYRLGGRRKYLDFLYQAGLGSKNSQGFGMACITGCLM